MGLPHEFELADLVLDVHALGHGGVALGDLLHLRERQHGLVQVVHGAHGRLVREHLADKALLALDDGVEIAVERAGRDVAEVVDAVETVALAHDAPQSLLEVGRPPRAVEVVDRGETRLHVRSGAERRGRPQQDADIAVAHFLVQRLLLLRLALGVGHAGDLGLGDAGLDEAAAHVVLDVPAPGGGRGGVHEHELGAALGLGALADVEDVLHACVDLAAGKRLHVGVVLEVEQLRVERDLPAVAGDLEHVVHARVATGMDLLAALHQRLDLGELFGRRRHRDRVALELGEVEVEVVCGLCPGIYSTPRLHRCSARLSTVTDMSPRRVRIAGTAFWLKPGGRDASSVPRRVGRSIRTERRDSRGIRLSLWRCALRPRGAGPGLPGRLLYCMQEHSDLRKSVAREMRGGIFRLDTAAPCGSRRPMR